MTTLLEVKGLTKTFGAVQAVGGIDFSIHVGRCVALLGPNGAGKTTTIRMIAGLLSQTAGTMRFHGFVKGDYGKGKVHIGYLPQSPSFYNWMSGLEYAVYAGRLCGLPAGTALKRAKELLERVGLSGAAKRRIGSYSGGMKQRLGLAQALVHSPKLLIMDEPVSALDPIGRREVLGLLQELKEETTVLFSTHALHDAEELCDDVIIIRKGQIALQGNIAAIRNEHRKPIIELQLEQDEVSIKWFTDYKDRLSRWSDEAQEASFIQNIEQQGAAVRFTVREVDSARQHLLEVLTREKVKVSRLEIGHTSLEDLFMKVVAP
ncbi:ABC transporter ATP-binding protein [Paenibacillus alkaliterrae]|uniref:ABC transporter ATP-binding protein n=1 Tax=Paenibacillus alkaliterrae TaxID=320909 RepID=UPI001F3DC9E8|nr:ABC transporter ATP-binding protein [Paenibacillus alkaliterrae]MCF2939071.1 ABC transporter ATP-binding protein [Paenibacillus alkaliterrae]